MKREEITPALVRELFDYDPESGMLTWRHRTSRKWNKSAKGLAVWNGQNAGKPALNYVGNDGYKHGRFQGIKLSAHRVAFCHFHGRWPEHTVDHDNGKRTDNRIKNLFDRTMTQNNRNAKMNRRNKSGINGVSWDRQNNKWIASIGVNNKNISLGRYRSLGSAAKMRKLAECLLGYHPNHGRAA